jgi:hypothetical protein
MWKLSITMMEFTSGKGFICSSSSSMNSAKRDVLNDPSMIFMVNIPSRELAGSMEYLESLVSVTDLE